MSEVVGGFLSGLRGGGYVCVVWLVWVGVGYSRAILCSNVLMGYGLFCVIVCTYVVYLYIFICLFV